MYESIMTKLPGYNGDQSWELPLAATYVVQPDGKISYARVDADWRKRPEPEELLRVVTDSVRKNTHRLKVLLQLHKLFHLNQLQPLRSGIHRFMLQRPCEIMRHKDGVDAGGQRRIDV